MSNYDETNRGAIWGNKNKEKDTDRDFQGSINVEGVDYWISGWRRKEGDNPNAPSVKFKITRKDANHDQGVNQTQQAMAPQQAQQEPAPAPPIMHPPSGSAYAQAPADDKFDDDIPF